MEQARKNLGKEKVELAIVLTSVEVAYTNAIKIILASLGPVPLLGASSMAVLSNGGIVKHGLGIMLISCSAGTYLNSALAKDIHTKSVIEAGEELGEKLLYGFKDMRRDVGVIFSDGLIPQGSHILQGLQYQLGSSFPLAGASASDDFSFQKTFIYFNHEILNDAVCGLLFGGRLSFGIGVKHGWQPLGKPHEITKSEANVIYEIDGKAAVGMYKEYLGFDTNKLRQELGHISILYPIGLYLSGEEEYLLRNIVSIRDDGSLLCQGDAPQNSQIRLMIGTKESCLDSTRQAIFEVKKGLSDHPAKLILVFESVSRYNLLGRQIGKELQMIKDGFGYTTPILGLYTYGEQAPLKAINYQGKTHFHNQTITMLGIGD